MPENRGRATRRPIGRRERGIPPRTPRPLDVLVLVAAPKGGPAPAPPAAREGLFAQLRFCHDAAAFRDQLVAADQSADAILLWFPDALWPPEEVRRLLAGLLPPAFLALPRRPAAPGWSGEASLLIHDGTLDDACDQLLSALGRSPQPPPAGEQPRPSSPPVSVMRVGVAPDLSPARAEETDDAERAARLLAAKFAALQESAAGLAHEMNNLVAPIAGYAQLLRTYASDERVGQRLDIIENSAFRASELIGDLLAFTRAPALEREPVRPAEWLAELVTDLTPKVEECGVHLLSHAPLDLPAVEMDPVQMRKALEHIVWNGVYAMEEEGTVGTIHLEARCERLSEADHRRFGFAALGALDPSTEVMEAGDRVLRLEIRDEGPGISDELLQRVFFPFVTTRSPDRGRGLGLAITYGIVRSHGGAIGISSPPAGGALVSLVLPAEPRDVA